VENAQLHVNMIRILAGRNKEQVLITLELRDKEFFAHNAVFFNPYPANVENMVSS
jgi:hypothetical protein